jgi:hypothetical protein
MSSKCSRSSHSRRKWRVKQDAEERAVYDQKWDKINENILSQKLDDYQEPPAIPFSSDKLIRDYNGLYMKIYDKVKAVEM